MLRKALLAALVVPVVFAATVKSAAACGTDQNVDFREQVQLREQRNRFDPVARAAELDRQAMLVDRQAQMHAVRAEQARSTAASLQETIPVSFGEERDAILDRIDALLERAATETGQARVLRLRASELRAEAARLRNVRDGGGWRNRRPVAPTPAPTTVDI